MDVQIQQKNVKCQHREFNDPRELKWKGKTFIELMLADYCRKHCETDATVTDMLSDEPVLCFEGYDNDEKVFVPIKLKEQVGEDGELLRDHLLDYVRDIEHTEEKKTIVDDSKVKYDPHQEEKEKNERNIEYVLGVGEPRQDSEFNRNVAHDLQLRGYKLAELPTGRTRGGCLQRIQILKDCLLTGRKVKRLRRALELEEKALCKRLLCPGISCPMCILHWNNRMVGKIHSK